ncbi:dihydroorotase [Sabulilitoribacter arenilitoris]|uniref:Dihydroorotase n=1 Tax=Wocania arenilitoris TaxID=2044858 RepID=A0AAE3JNQ8_9FLAO|nr:dihydroorotase [Wocania arenilitoris]MCF7568926.1 dihydroorotase [Wocania arenilitoris]
MKNNILFTLLLVFFTSLTYSQNTDTKVNIGDLFIIGETDNYKHINLPKRNFIIKQGGIANYESIKGKTVEVTSIKEKNGNLIATIKLVSKKKFFNSHKYVTVNISKAIDNKELISL